MGTIKETFMIISNHTLRISFRNAGFLGSLGCALVLGAASLVAKDHGTKQGSDAGQQHFRFEAISDKSLKLWQGEHPVLVYNHGVMTSQSAPKAQGRSSYFHPIYGLEGEVLTDDF